MFPGGNISSKNEMKMNVITSNAGCFWTRKFRCYYYYYYYRVFTKEISLNYRFSINFLNCKRKRGRYNGKNRLACIECKLRHTGKQAIDWVKSYHCPFRYKNLLHWRKAKWIENPRSFCTFFVGVPYAFHFWYVLFICCGRCYWVRWTNCKSVEKDLVSTSKKFFLILAITILSCDLKWRVEWSII